MNAVLIFVMVVLACAGTSSADSYTDRFDNINIKEILNNPRLINAYINCILEKGKCTSEGKELKSHIREALATNCAKCTEKQRQGTREVISFLINKKQEAWASLTEKYDPKRIYSVQYEKELKSIQG